MGEGKFFFVRSYLNGFVLDVQNGNSYPGCPVVTWHQRADGNDNQLFYEDPESGTIRTKLNDYCLDIQDDSVVINPFQPGNSTQQWMIAGNRIQSRFNPDQVFDIADNNQDAGARVCTWGFHGGQNQLWSIEYTAPRYFYLRSQMHGKVADIRGADPTPGGKVISYEQVDGMADNQLWYEDRYGVIRSKLNDFAMDSADGTMRMNPYDPSNPMMQWVLMGNRVVNRNDPNMVLDIKGGSSSNNVKLIPYEYNGGDNQHWTLDYIE